MSNEISNIHPTTSEVAITLDQLADRILLVDETLRQQAAHAVNCMSSESRGRSSLLAYAESRWQSM